jgi:hypothetical protein
VSVSLIVSVSDEVIDLVREVLDVTDNVLVRLDDLERV